MTSVHEALHAWLPSAIGALRGHLLLSTLLLVLLLALSHLSFFRARTRYALVLLGVLKFAVPAALFAPFAARLPEDVGLAYVLTIPATFTGAAGGGGSETLCILFGVWVAGVLLVLQRAAAGHLACARVARGAVPAGEREAAALRRIVGGPSVGNAPRLLRSSLPSAMTTGIFRPAIVLPDGSIDSLEMSELDAVLAHELGHVTRRHNLGAAACTAVLALFWFHPLLWLAERRLRGEAEKDCDERALRFVPHPLVYLSGMLKICRGLLAPGVAGASYMSGTQLKERMDHMMKQQESKSPTASHRIAIVVAAAAVALTTLLASAGETARPAAPSTAATAGGTDEDVTLPKVLTKVDPAYPESARKKKVEGLVVVAASIDATGKVTKVAVAHGIEGEEGEALEKAALDAVKQWTFEPARRNGSPVAIVFKVTIRFALS